MNKLKIMTILGTRPEIIRLSRVMAKLDSFTEHVVVHTGQNYDYELNEVFFEEMRIRRPDIFLNVDPSSLGSVLGNILIKMESVLTEQKPDAVLILGDTNSSIAGILAKRFKIPIYHMEAGNRSFDQNVPEEVNRKIIDHIADFNLVYTEHARRHLLSEGLPHRRIVLTGSPMKEVLRHYSEQIDASAILENEGLSSKGYFLVSMHREENVDNPLHLQELINSLISVHNNYKLPVLVSTHPRTKNRIESLPDFVEHKGITFSKPFGFFDYNKLQKDAFCVLSDSGTITEEASLLQFPAVTIRRSMERPEGIDTGSIVLTGLESDVVLQGVHIVTESIKTNGYPPAPNDYCIENVSDRVLKLVVGTAKLSNDWWGVRKHGE